MENLFCKASPTSSLSQANSIPVWILTMAHANRHWQWVTDTLMPKWTLITSAPPLLITIPQRYPPQTSGSTHLDVAAPGDLHKLLLFLQRLVHLVVGHAEHAEAPLLWWRALAKDNKLGHVGHSDCLLVQQAGHVGHLGDLLAVDQPEPAACGMFRDSPHT